MHFITFPVASTNIFPLSNSTQGGQLVTEFNLRSNDMVATNPAVKYPVGPSFIHCADDFKVSLLENPDVDDYDGTITYAKGDYCRYNDVTYVCTVAITVPEATFDPTHWTKTSISTSILQVGAGRAVINGYYVETFAPMQVDLNLANAELARLNQGELFGNLSIGIKSYFSTSSTMAGSLLVENSDNMYQGIQLVITATKDFTTPADCPAESQQGQATADLKLADFTYINGVISASSIVPNPDAMRYIPSERIYDYSSLLDDKYVSSEGVTANKLYTLSGTSKWWCDSTDSLMVWDAHPEQHTVPGDDYQTVGEAQFVKDAKSNVHLVIPHKQVDKDPSSTKYLDVDLPFPTANYNQETSGIVTKEYTKQIKEIANVINTYKQFTGGKQIMYLDSLSVDSDGNITAVPSYTFPKDIDSQGFNVGDYILVREDYTVTGLDDTSSGPSTMYVVIPGGVSNIGTMTTTKPSGTRLGAPWISWEKDGDVAPTTEDPTPEELAEQFNYTTCRGSINDYFEIIFHNLDDTVVTSYYYPVTAAGPKSWSEAILLTGGIPLATEEQIGGFYNASTDEEYADAGYVYLDDTGHLRLLDYALLRTGALAYQLGQDYSVASNTDIESIQAELDESVNERVAFKTSAALSNTPTMINVNIPLPEDEEGVINIYKLDSRFGTGVYLHFIAEADKDYSDLIINILDCEKIRIDSSISVLQKGPIINVFRCGLFYDASVIDYIRLVHKKIGSSFTGFEGLNLWYTRFSDSDPDLIVNGMEISQPNVSKITEDVTFWDETVSDDNHYAYALRSITLSGSGSLIGCSLYVSNNSTVKNLGTDATKPIIIGGEFELPQGAALNYPISSIDNSLQVTGTFTTAYFVDSTRQWVTTDTTFTAKTGEYTSNGLGEGSIAFKSITYFIGATYTGNITNIDGWAPGSYHIFYGGTTV